MVPDQSASPEIMVSVCMITYNHEQFIAQAIESVLMQQTEFNYELIIGEDYSTDSTREIVLEYATKYPHLVKALLRENNLGMIRNFIDVIERCSGKYIALLEGDDYWTDPLKLQKQVDLLSAHEDYSICFHSVDYGYDDGSIKPSPYKNLVQKEFYSLKDLLIKNIWTKTCTCMFVNEALSQFPNWYDKLRIGDWPMFVLISQRGNIGYINDIMAVYRVHESSVFSTIGLKEQYIAIIQSREAINTHFDYQYNDLLAPHIFQYYYLLNKQLISNGEIIDFRYYFWKSLHYVKHRTNISFLYVFIQLLISFIPNQKIRTHLVYKLK